MAAQPPDIQGNLPLGQTASTGQSVTPIASRGGGAVRSEHVVAIVRAEVGKMKAEIEKDLEGKLTNINAQLGKLPTTITFISTVVGALVLAFSLLFAILSWSDSREGKVSEKSATIATSLATLSSQMQQVSMQTQENSRAIQEAKKPPTGGNASK